MKNVIDASNVIALRRLDLFRLIKQKLFQENIIFDQDELLKIIEDLDNMSFLTKKEKSEKTVNPQLEVAEILRENPTISERIADKLQK